MHHSAIPYFTLVVRNYFQTIYINLWTGREVPQEWPPKSPVLNELNLFLLPVYTSPLNTELELGYIMLVACDENTEEDISTSAEVHENGSRSILSEGAIFKKNDVNVLGQLCYHNVVNGCNTHVKCIQLS